MKAKPQIKIETFIEATTLEVWQAITQKELISQWLMETDIEPIVGFQGYFKMKPVAGFNGQITAEVLRVEPNKLFVYTWQSDWMKTPTTIQFTLTEKEGGTLLTLEHWGFEGFKGFFLRKMMSGGWKKLVGIKIPELIKSNR